MVGVWVVVVVATVIVVVVVVVHAVQAEQHLPLLLL